MVILSGQKVDHDFMDINNEEAVNLDQDELIISLLVC